MKQILIIEDDNNLSRGIAFAFERDGFLVKVADTITDAQKKLAQDTIDLVILDIGLPDGSGLDLCKEIRRRSTIPIIMLTACDLETDEVLGLLAGADDYITKPFSLAVLRARVEVLFRRLENQQEQQLQPQQLQSGEYRLDTALCKLYRGEEEIPISVTEFRLLKYFLSNVGQVLSKDQILTALWDNQGKFVDENTLSVNISRLRSKMEADPKNPKTIQTVQGIGYVWVKE